MAFRDDGVEQAYRDSVVSSILLYVRLAWGSVILFGGPFAFLDKSFFGEHASIVITARVVLLALASTILGLTWLRSCRRVFALCPTLFILSVGSFCILQTALSPPDAYSPYIMGVFLAFCGTFCTVGMGFRFSFFALIGSLAVFELFVGVLFPVETDIFVVYNFFFVSFTLAFIFLGYYTEAVARRRYVVSARLEESIDQIKTLSGLLPVCASCKQVRDDRGYWKQIESYLAQHSEVVVSHSICPDCLERLYPDFARKRKEATL